MHELLGFWHYFQAHYQDNVVAGFINSMVLVLFTWFVLLKKMFICKEPRCFRWGHHKVEGTHYKTCPKHTTNEIHKKWQAHHAKKHPAAHAFLKKK